MTVAGIMEKINRGAVKSVQRGVISGAAAGNYFATISAVNMRKSIVLFGGENPGSAITDLGYLILYGPGTVLFCKAGSNTSTVAFQVIEFY